VESDEHVLRLNYQTPEQLSEGLLTLSLQPKSKWTTLLNLDTIKKRNKPKEAPKAPEKAPFFLPTIAGLEPKFVIEANRDQDADSSRILRYDDLDAQTELARRLEINNPSSAFEFLKGLAPAAVDFEIRSLPLTNNCASLKALLRVLIHQLGAQTDYELVETFLAVTLGIHGDIMVANRSEFADLLQELLQQHQSVWSKVEQLFQSAACVVDFIRQ
jgi:U3 small nucleolar RNA-associated protein 21